MSAQDGRRLQAAPYREEVVLSYRDMPTPAADVVKSLMDIETEDERQVWTAAFALRCSAWSEHPTGSLPSDERALMRAAGFPKQKRVWERIRERALAGWSLHSDGRLYHPEVTEIVLAAWDDLLFPKSTTRPAIPLHVRRAVWDRDGECCAYCGATSGPFALDHITPWSRGGPDTVENLPVSCRPCNSSKSDKTPEEWLS